MTAYAITAAAQERQSTEWKYGRTAIVRMAKILNRLQEHKPVTASKMAEVFECSQKTVQRDLEYMRDQLGIPLIYSPSLRTFCLDPDAKWSLSRKATELILRSLNLDDPNRFTDVEWNGQQEYEDGWSRLFSYSEYAMTHVLQSHGVECRPRANKRGIVKG